MTHWRGRHTHAFVQKDWQQPAIEGEKLTEPPGSALLSPEVMPCTPNLEGFFPLKKPPNATAHEKAAQPRRLTEPVPLVQWELCLHILSGAADILFLGTEMPRDAGERSCSCEAAAQNSWEAA